MLLLGFVLCNKSGREDVSVKLYVLPRSFCTSSGSESCAPLLSFILMVKFVQSLFYIRLVFNCNTVSYLILPFGKR